MLFILPQGTLDPPFYPDVFTYDLVIGPGHVRPPLCRVRHSPSANDTAPVVQGDLPGGRGSLVVEPRAPASLFHSRR